MADEVDTKHPDYLDRSDEWLLMRHSVRGQTAFHAEGTRYLPMPSGFRAQPDKGADLYAAYLTRARYFELLAPMLRGMVGLIHRTEAQVTMPNTMNPIWERATLDGLPLEAFHRRITNELLLMGRYGVLVDAPREGRDVPHLAGYHTESIINWSKERDFFVLDETGLRRDGFRWETREQYRALVLSDGIYTQDIYNRAGERQEETITPTRRGNGALEEIPFVIANSKDLSTVISEPPLLGVARAAMAAYQMDADYRHQLYMSGQETLFISGLEKDLPKQVGAAIIQGLPLGAKAEYVGPSGRTIEAHRQAINDAKDEAISAAAHMFDRQAGRESGEALRLRYAAQTANLTTVAMTSAQMLEKALRHAAIFMGLKPEDVVVKPNLKFVESVMNPQDARALMEMWLGRAISKQTLYENLQRGEIASAERDFEEEEGLIEAEPIDEPIPGGDEGV